MYPDFAGATWPHLDSESEEHLLARLREDVSLKKGSSIEMSLFVGTESGWDLMQSYKSWIRHESNANLMSTLSGFACLVRIENVVDDPDHAGIYVWWPSQCNLIYFSVKGEVYRCPDSYLDIVHSSNRKFNYTGPCTQVTGTVIRSLQNHRIRVDMNDTGKIAGQIVELALECFSQIQDEFAAKLLDGVLVDLGLFEALTQDFDACCTAYERRNDAQDLLERAKTSAYVCKTSLSRLREMSPHFGEKMIVALAQAHNSKTIVPGLNAAIMCSYLLARDPGCNDDTTDDSLRIMLITLMREKASVSRVQ